MRIDSDSHLHGEVIAEHAFPEECDSIRGILGGIEIPLRPVDVFTTSGRPLHPKRHQRTIGGARKPFLLPVDQAELNSVIDLSMRGEGWDSQPLASGVLDSGAPSDLRGDFARNRVFVEVEFGNVASMYRDFFKFQIASRARAGDVAILILATEKLAKFFDSGVATMETARRRLPFLSIGIQMPIWFVGIEPPSFDSIGARYEEMRVLCSENGLDCHSFEAALGAKVDTEEPALPDEGSS